MASTAELEAEILADLEENPDAYTAPVNDVINRPSSEVLFGTEEEQGVERKYFKCPRIVGDNIDLFTHQIYISYMAVKDKNATFIPDSIPQSYWCDDVALDETGNYITFSWLLSGNVLASRGFVGFAVIAKSVEGDILKTRWKTAPAVGTVLMTVPDAGEGIAELYPDIITQLLDRMDAVEEIATVEAMQGYVDDYLGRNPVQLDSTLTDNTKAAPAGIVGELKGDLSQLSEEIANKTGTGLSTEAIDKLEEVGNYLAYTTADGGSKWTELISILRNGSSGDSGGTEVTISSISATYTGGDVEEGTALSDLTGITVIATYSDGSTATVTGYTLSGEIAEGENTITVSYGGKTTTFTVIGTASVSAGETIVYNVFTGEYINSGYSGDNYTNYGANYNIYQEEIDVTDASTLYYRFGRNNKVTGATQSGLKLGVYSSDGSVLGVLDLSDSSTVTEVDGKYDINGLETLDDGTVIYGIYVASVSLSSFENKSYVKFAVLRSSKFVPRWNGNAQSTSALSLEV